MRTRLVKEKVIQDFVVKHVSSKSTFRIWLDVLKSADWTSLEDVKAIFPATDILGKGAKRVVFPNKSAAPASTSISLSGVLIR